jgi:hypothetical protein
MIGNREPADEADFVLVDLRERWFQALGPTQSITSPVDAIFF